MSFGHERRDVYRAAIEYVGGAYHLCERLRGHRNAKEMWGRRFRAGRVAQLGLLGTAAGVSPLVVGLTVVAYGTSSPEVAVSLEAAVAGRTDMALGNVVGSNIFNVLFILGVSALIVPLVVHQQLVRIDVPVMIGVSLLTLVLAQDGRIARGEGLALLAGMIGDQLQFQHPHAHWGPDLCDGARANPRLAAKFALQPPLSVLGQHTRRVCLCQPQTIEETGRAHHHRFDHSPACRAGGPTMKTGCQAG